MVAPDVPAAPNGLAGTSAGGASPVSAAVGRAAITPAAPANRSRRDRGWLVTTVAVVLIAVALGVAGVLLGHTGAGRQLFGAKHAAAPSNHPIALAAGDVHAFDPFGDRHENDSQLANLVDGHSAGWQTEHYRDADFGGLKSGVGLYVVLDRPVALSTLTVQSPSAGWSASIYVASATPPDGADISAWGQPVTSASNIDAGLHTFDLGQAKGTAVLVWITKLARLDGGSCSSGSLCWGVQLSQLGLAS
jgi:hypothetical protein